MSTPISEETDDPLPSTGQQIDEDPGRFLIPRIVMAPSMTIIKGTGKSSSGRGDEEAQHQQSGHRQTEEGRHQQPQCSDEPAADPQQQLGA